MSVTAVTESAASGFATVDSSGNYANLVAKRFNPVRHPDNRYLWTVGVEYDTERGFSLGSGGLEVTYYLPLIRFGFVPYTKVVEYDINGNPIANSAGQPFDPPPEIDDYRLIAYITRNEAIYDPSTALYYQNAINTNVIFGGVGQHQAKLNGLGGTRRNFHNTLWWEVEYQVQFKLDTWILKKPDKGKFSKWTSPTGSVLWEPVRAGDGVPVTTDVYLDGSGGVLENPTVNNIVKREFHVYPERDFTPLNLPALVVNLNPNP